MIKFIQEWKKLDTRFAELLDGNGNIEIPGLRKLSMESEDDRWFVQTNSNELPKPTGKEYDHMQMSRLLYGSHAF